VQAADEEAGAVLDAKHVHVNSGRSDGGHNGIEADSIWLVEVSLGYVYSTRHISPLAAIPLKPAILLITSFRCARLCLILFSSLVLHL
jgi:hypothetical protein